MSLTGRQVQVSSYPQGPVRPEHFEVVEVPIDPVGPGEVLVRNTWTSVDPGLRLRLREAAPEGYFVAFPLHAAMDGIMTIGEVIESQAEGFEVGDTVWHAQGWRDFAVQIAKLHGNRVVASAGSDDKVRWLLDDLKVDAAFSYRTAAVRTGLAAA